MIRKMLAVILTLCLLAPPSLVIAASGCTYPSSLDTWADKSSGDQLTVADVNTRTCAIEQLEVRLNQIINGKSAGQTITGGTASGDDLTLSSTAHATKGLFLFDHAIQTGASASDLVLKNLASIRWVNNAGTSSASYGIGGGAGDDLNFNAAGRFLFGTTVVTGTSAGDIVLPNAKAIRFVSGGGGTAANFGMSADNQDNLVLGAFSTSDSINFNWGAANLGWLQAQNSGMGILFATESSADHAAPSANQAALYTKDNGSGKTMLVVRFATGAVQVIATEP